MIGKNERIIFLVNNRTLVGYGGFADTPPYLNETRSYTIVIFKSSLTKWSLFAHEIGHTFSLEHPFDTNSFTKGSSRNFMDYTSKMNMFWYWQWRIMNKKDFK